MSRKNLRKLDLDPVDPNVKVPTMVARQAAAADEAFKAAYGETTITDAPPVEPNSPAEPSETVQQPVQDGGPAAEAPTDPVAPPSAAGGDQWEHRYRSIKGRFDQQSDEMTRQQQRLDELEQLIATMRTGPQVPSQPQRLITPEEETDYGTDFLDVVSRTAKQELAPQIETIASRLDNIAARLDLDTSQRGETLQQQLWGYLDEQIPNWQEINASDEFLEWLALPDEYSGAIRRTLITQAFERHDAPRVARFFNGFLAEEAAAGNRRPSAGQRQAPVSVNGGRLPTGKVPLARLAAPGRARTGASSELPPEKPLISRAQIAQFYSDVAANRYRGREAEKNSLEAQIFEAGREGRITN
jgi:hypothetical protein